MKYLLLLFILCYQLPIWGNQNNALVIESSIALFDNSYQYDYRIMTIIRGNQALVSIEDPALKSGVEILVDGTERWIYDAEADRIRPLSQGEYRRKILGVSLSWEEIVEHLKQFIEENQGSPLDRETPIEILEQIAQPDLNSAEKMIWIIEDIAIEEDISSSLFSKNSLKR